MSLKDGSFVPSLVCNEWFLYEARPSINLTFKRGICDQWILRGCANLSKLDFIASWVKIRTYLAGRSFCIFVLIFSFLCFQSSPHLFFCSQRCYLPKTLLYHFDQWSYHLKLCSSDACLPIILPSVTKDSCYNKFYNLKCHKHITLLCWAIPPSSLDIS